MIIVITAGGLIEKIDDVREISNYSTGALGKLIAESFLKHFKDAQIIYIHGLKALLPNHPKIEYVPVKDNKEAEREIRRVLTENQVQVFVHAMAVSDYHVAGIYPTRKLIELISQESLKTSDLTLLEEALWAEVAKYEIEKKLNSKDNLQLFLRKNPKIIKIIKELSPKTLLVGFKLLPASEELELVEAGYQLLKENDCDFVLSNSKEQINEKEHVGILISADKSYIKKNSKQEIADTIVEKVYNKFMEERK